MSVPVEAKVCSRIYERIAAGEKPDHILYRSEAFGLLVVLARDAVRPGHTLVIPDDCQANVDDLSPQAHQRLFIASRHIGRVISDAFCSGPNDRVGQLVSGTDVAHTHVHRFPIIEGDGNAPWRRFAREEPFIDRSSEQVAGDLAYLQLYFTAERQDAMEAELAAVGPR